MPDASSYPLALEKLYAVHPRECRAPDVLFIGSAIGLGSAPYLQERCRREGCPSPRIVVADAGPFDLINHVAHARGFPRHPILRLGGERVGGQLTLWGMSTPRPPEYLLRQWPYPSDDLERRFQQVEAEMGVPDRIPFSFRNLETFLKSDLQDRFPDCPIEVAPLAIDGGGNRWTPLEKVPDLVAGGMGLLPHFRCTRLLGEGDHITGVRGSWSVDGCSYTLRPRIVVLGVGVVPSLPLVRQVVDGPLPLEVSDHIRIDLHGRLAPGTFGRQSVEELGVAILIMECRARASGVPYHLEIKVAPRALWVLGAMQSSDNLRADDSDDALFVQVQAVAAMHDRLPSTDLLQAGTALPPVMSARDAAFHGEIIAVMREVAGALGLAEPTFNLRPLLTNHHVYGAYRVGKAVSKEFRLAGFANLYILPTSAYVDFDDDANPPLKSRVLAQYAMDDIVRELAGAAALCNGQVLDYSL